MFIVDFSDGRSQIMLPRKHHEVLHARSRALKGTNGFKWCFANEMQEAINNQVRVDFTN